MLNIEKKLSESKMGVLHSETTKKKLSEIRILKWQDEEYKQMMSLKFKEGHTGTSHSKSTKDKMSMSCSKRKLSENEVVLIRMRYLNGDKVADILKDFPIVTMSTLAKVCSGRTFKHIPNTIEELKHLKSAN